MGVPQHRRSKSRNRDRRAHLKLTSPQFVECPQCHEATMPHRVCPTCGHYKGKEVIVKDAQ